MILDFSFRNSEKIILSPCGRDKENKCDSTQFDLERGNIKNNTSKLSIINKENQIQSTSGFRVFNIDPGNDNISPFTFYPLILEREAFCA